ncbi:MAG: carboxypeptidase-like regulatory domain-containing protein [Bacteroidales bacterium]
MTNYFLLACFFIGIFFLRIDTISSQNVQDTSILIHGQVVTEDNRPVSLAHIINIDYKTGIATDTLGFFKIWVKPTNTLVVSAIGFEFTEYTIPLNITETKIIIKVKRKIYELPEVSITYFGTYKDFKYKVVNLKLKDENKINMQVLKDLPKVENPVPYEPTLGSPISLLYDAFSKEGKSRRKYMEIKAEEPIKLKAEAKYNREIVKNLTGLFGTELDEFMKSCNYSYSFILSLSDYDLYREIISKSEEFKKRNKKPEDLN